MSRRPNPRADLLRQAVAEEAARIMREQGVDDYLLAKRKAAERLGVTDASILPRNTEIEAALVAHQRLFAADRHEADLAAMRRSALIGKRAPLRIDRPQATSPVGWCRWSQVPKARHDPLPTSRPSKIRGGQFS